MLFPQPAGMHRCMWSLSRKREDGVATWEKVDEAHLLYLVLLFAASALLNSTGTCRLGR